jgi:hypothetical protein
MSLDLLRARVVFRDRSFADVVDLSLRFLAVHWRSYLKVSVVSLLPALLGSIALGYWLGWVAAWFITLPIAIFVETPFTILASRLVFQDRVRVRDVMRSTLSDSFRLVFARSFAITCVLFGLPFLVLPGFWLATIFFFLSEVMLLERAPLGTALARAQRVSSAATSDVIIGIFFVVLAPLVAVFLADWAGRTIIGDVLMFRPPAAIWYEGGSVLGTIGLFLSVPFVATARFFLYLNVRTRVEGWDIQTRFAEIKRRFEAAA